MRKTVHISIVIIAVLAASCKKNKIQDSNIAPLVSAELRGDETIETPYGEIELQHNYITDEDSEKLFDAMDLQRASQAYIWSTPIVSMVTFQIEQDKNYNTGKLGEFGKFESLKEKRGILTPNLTTPYILQFCNLSDGAIVIDYPAGATAGGILDFWQRPLADLGLTGPDQGKGGKYIVVSPDDDIEKYKSEGIYVYQSPTNNILVGLRILDKSPEFAKTFMSELKMGRVGEEIMSCTFYEKVDKEWSATAYRGLDYWKTLHKIISEEPIREKDKAWMALIEPLGIEKGKEFSPTERQKKILTEGASLGELMLRNLQTNPRFAKVYWEGTSWYKCFDFGVSQMTDTKVEIDERAVWFYEAVTSSEGMVNPVVGKGQVYMTTKRDNKGNLLRADKTYKLTVPKDVPVAQFWALTLYSEDTRRLYDNGGTEGISVNLDSRMEQLKYNEDGSIDLFIGAEAPEGMESNFMKTVDKDGWFVYFRLYAPTEPFFDKTFSLPDFEVLE